MKSSQVSSAECAARGIEYLGRGNAFGPSGTDDLGPLCSATPVECVLLQMAHHDLVADTTQIRAHMHEWQYRLLCT